MTAQPRIELFKQIEPQSDRPFRLLETIITSDGPRSRVCDGTWKFEAEARFELATRSVALGLAVSVPAIDAENTSRCPKCQSSVIDDDLGRGAVVHICTNPKCDWEGYST